VKNLIIRTVVLLTSLFCFQLAGATVVEYDFATEGSDTVGEGGYAAYTSYGDSAGVDDIAVTATASSFDGTTSLHAYLDGFLGSDPERPSGLGVCSTGLEAGEGSECNVSADDNLGSGVAGGEMLTLAWDQMVTITEIAFRNGLHHTYFNASGNQDFEVRVDGGAWQDYNLPMLDGIFTGALIFTPLYGMTFDFIVDDTKYHDLCEDAVCADDSSSELYISAITIETPEPGMVILFLLGITMIAFSTRQRKQA
jgi:hypothetical protein